MTTYNQPIWVNYAANWSEELHACLTMLGHRLTGPGTLVTRPVETFEMMLWNIWTAWHIHRYILWCGAAVLPQLWRLSSSTRNFLNPTSYYFTTGRDKKTTEKISSGEVLFMVPVERVWYHLPRHNSILSSIRLTALKSRIFLIQQPNGVLTTGTIPEWVVYPSRGRSNVTVANHDNTLT